MQVSYFFASMIEWRFNSLAKSITAMAATWGVVWGMVYLNVIVQFETIFHKMAIKFQMQKASFLMKPVAQ